MLLLTNRQVRVENSFSCPFLVIDHPEFLLRCKIRSFCCKKEGRICLRLEDGPGRDPVPAVLTPREAEFIGTFHDLSRYSFLAWCREVLQNAFPQERWRQVSFSGYHNPCFDQSCVCFRAVPKNGSTQATVLADYDLHPESMYRTLSTAVLWQVRIKKHASKYPHLQMHLIVPARNLNMISRILHWMDGMKMPWHLYGYREKSTFLQPFDYARAPSVCRTGKSLWPSTKPWSTSELLDRIHREFPHCFRRFPRADGGSSFRLLGLEIIRSHGPAETPLCFGPPDFQRELSEETFGDFRALVEQVQAIRRQDSSDRTHPFYRWQGERWLEEILLCNIEALDPDLDPRFVYSQVPTMVGGHRGILDVLTVNREGRLVVVEIKVERDPDLLFQSLDYWERVHRHNLENEFESRGYFPGRSLRKEFPLLYMTAPALAFHPAVKIQAAMVRPGIPIYRIGLRGDWRKNLQVSFRERLSPY